MTFTYATLGAILLLVVTAAVGSTSATDSSPWSYPPTCTPEAQQCLEKLEARLRLHGHTRGGAGIEQALLELQETDPGCTLLLRSVTLTGF